MKMQARVKKHSLKLISVFLSLFLWVYVLNSEKVKFEKTVQLEFILPDGMVFAEKPVQEVVFMIEGPRAFVRTVGERDDKLLIDLNRANTKKQTNFTVDIIPTQLNLPFGMVVERVLPRKIPVKLEQKSKKILPVRARFSGHLPEQLSLAKSAVEPGEVEVHGPRSLLKKIKNIPTRPIDLEGLVGLTEIPVELQLPDDRLRVEGVRDLKFVFQLKATSANFTLNKQPIRFLTQHKKLVTPTKTASIKLLVPDRLKNRSNISSSVQVWAEIPANARGKVEVPLKAIIPPGVHLLGITPKSIIVNVQ